MTHEKHNTPKKSFRRWVVPTLALLSLAVVVVILDELEKPPANAPEPFQATAPLVSFVEVASENHQAKIRAFGAAKPRWQTTLNAVVRGRISYISPQLLEGSEVAADTLLLKVEDHAYRANLEENKNRLRQAEVALLEIERVAQQAKREWERSGLTGEPDSPLMFQQPQQLAAEQELASARAALAHAEVQLSQTELRAPYRGTILTKSVSPGDYIEVGQQLLTMMDVAVLEIPVLLNRQQWALMREDWQSQTAMLRCTDREFSGLAQIDRASGMIDRNSGMRELYITYRPSTSGSDPLLPGEFVEVVLPGKDMTQLLRVPQSAYTRDGYLWVIDNQNQLQRVQTAPLFVDQTSLFFPKPDQYAVTAGWRIAVIPQARFVPGMQVTPTNESLTTLEVN
jgi:RND family efflux transporter MFP subunit